jgi:hypothetical protein
MTAEQQFWKWFQTNDEQLFNFESNQERTFDLLLREMHKVNPDLTFEFGPKQNGRREFIISADGIKTAFQKVEELYASAPSLPHWKFVKFRPRRAPADISFANISVKASDVKVELKPGNPKADITVCFPAYSEPERRNYVALAFLFLDQALGEYDVEMHVDRIEVKNTKKASRESMPIQQLPTAFDKSLGRQ